MKVNVDPYTDRKSGILKNKAGVKDKKELDKLEADYTALNMRNLQENPVKGNFDFQHLCKIHEYIFQDLYEWAGSPRIIDIEKEEDVLGGLSIQYSQYECIKKDAEKVIEKMHSIEWDKLSLDERVVEFSNCMSDLWKVHPFREGNTRTIVTFCRDFAESKGFGLDSNLFEKNSAFVRNALVASSAKFSDIGDYSKPEYLYRIVKDGMERWGKEKQEEKSDMNNGKQETMNMNDWRSTVEKSNDNIGFENTGRTFDKAVEIEKEIGE